MVVRHINLAYNSPILISEINILINLGLPKNRQMLILDILSGSD